MVFDLTLTEKPRGPRERATCNLEIAEIESCDPLKSKVGLKDAYSPAQESGS